LATNTTITLLWEMNDHLILTIAETLTRQWAELPRNKHAAHAPMELEHEKFVRHLAAQLTNDNLTPLTNNSFEQQLARESARVLIYEDRELLVSVWKQHM
jgi:hypothetical protein